MGQVMKGFECQRILYLILEAIGSPWNLLNKGMMARPSLQEDPFDSLAKNKLEII